MIARIELVPLTVAGALAAGATHALFASIKEPLARRLSLDDGQVGWLTAAWYATLLPTLLISGMLIDQAGVEWVMIAGFMLTALAAALLAIYTHYQVAVAMVFLLGAGSACVLSSVVVLMPPAFNPDSPVAAVNLGAFFLFIGVLLMPLAVNRLMPQIGFRRLLGSFALISLAPTLLAALTPGDAFPAAQGGELGRVILDPVIVLAAATYFLYVPIERTVRDWASAYLIQEGYSEQRTNAWLLAFWISFLAGRLAAVWFVEQTQPTVRVEPWLVLALVALAAVALGNLAGAPGHYSAGWGLPFVGLVMGPILPTLIGIALHKFPNQPGTAFGTLYAIGTLGALLLAPAIGPYTRSAAAFRMPMALALAAGGAALALALLVR